MNIKCNRAALYEAVQLAASIVPARTPKPILQCAKLEANQKEKKVVVSATDNEISIRYMVNQVEINDGGAVVVPADRLAAILHECTDNIVDLEVTDATCQISGKDSCFHVYGHDPDDFPVFSIPATDGAFSIKGAILHRMIRLSTFAAARESTRYAINGVLWEQNNKKLRMVATDGRRLALTDGGLVSAGQDSENSGIVPAKTMTVLDKVVQDTEEKVSLSFTTNQIVASVASVEISSNLVQGHFPKYADVIPAESDKKVKLELESFSSAVRQASLLSTDQSRGIRMIFDKGQLLLSSSTPEAGDAQVNLKVAYDDELLDIGFNPRYLLDVLRVVEDPEVIFEFTDGNKPALLKAGKKFLYVIMPVTG